MSRGSKYAFPKTPEVFWRERGLGVTSQTAAYGRSGMRVDHRERITGASSPYKPDRPQYAEFRRETADQAPQSFSGPWRKRTPAIIAVNASCEREPWRARLSAPPSRQRRHSPGVSPKPAWLAPQPKNEWLPASYPTALARPARRPPQAPS